MSRETLEWLNQNTLIGFGRKAWHFSQDAQGAESNHYAAAIPVEDVARRLFSWTADGVDLTYSFNGEEITAAGKQAIIHSETGALLGVHSDKYTVHQYQDSLLGGVRKICGNGLGIESAGLLQAGAVGWVSVSLPDTSTVEVAGGSSGIEYLTRLLAFGSHNGKYPTSYKLVNTLVVCDNTLALAVGERGNPHYKIRHTTNSQVRVEDAHAALGLIVAGQDAFAAEVAKLVETTVTDKQWATFVERIAPIAPDAVKGKALTIAETKRERLTELYRADERVAPWKGTAFGAFQAVNTWNHWDSIVRGAERQERNTLNQLDGSWEASDAKTLQVLRGVLQDA